MSQWRLLHYWGSAPTFCPEILAEEAREKLNTGQKWLDLSSEQAVLDSGGTCLKKRHWWSSSVGEGMRVTIPSIDAELFGALLEIEQPKKSLGGLTYYILSGYIHQVWLLDHQREALLKDLDVDRKKIKQEAREDDERMQAAMKDIPFAFHDMGVKN